MRVLVDTSAFIAFLIAEDEKHSSALDIWKALADSGDQLTTSNYVIVETCALLHRRFGVKAVRRFVEDVVPVVLVEWVDVNTHLAGIGGMLMSGRRGPGLIDCVSFVVMRKLNIHTAFTFDPHFKEQGFECLPGQGR